MTTIHLTSGRKYQTDVPADTLNAAWTHIFESRPGTMLFVPTKNNVDGKPDNIRINPLAVEVIEP